MSIIGNAFNNWQQRYQNPSAMRQEVSVCDRIPPATKDKMVEISVESVMYPGEYKPEKVRERGAPITQDYTLGDVMIGTRDRVAISRPPGTIGTYHTHPFGSPFPSPYDTIEALDKDDKLMCIGATGKPGTRIQCFTPNKPKWSDSQYKFRLLADDIKDFNKRFKLKYKPRANLRAFLQFVGSPSYTEKIQYTTPEELRKEAAKAEESVTVALEATQAAHTQAIEATEAMRAAQVTLSKAMTKVEIAVAETELRAKEKEAERTAAKIEIERRLARDARVAADKAAFTADKSVLGVAEATAESKLAMECLDEGAKLATRKSALIGQITSELRQLSYPKEWTAFKHGEYIPYFDAFPNVFNKCRIIWEGFEEELPYEL